MNFKDKVRAGISRHGMLSGGERVLVAVSGGPDSMALLHVLAELQDELSLTLAVAHYHHQLRGKDADLDQKLAMETARKMGAEFYSGKAEPEWWKKLKGSIEELARNMRYEFLSKTAQKNSADKIALGHNADDRAESVLINLLRGSGLLGLAGMPLKRDQFVRPLIETSRQEILDYCWENSLGFRVDKSNRDRKILRNRIRAELVPMLKSFNPAIVGALGKTAELLAADEKFLEQESKAVFARLAQCRPGQVDFHLPVFFKQDLAIQRRLIRLAIQKLKKNLRRIESGHIFELESLLAAGQASFEMDLPDGIRIFKSYDQLRIEPARLKPESKFAPVQLTIPGAIRISPEEGFELELKAEPSDYGRFERQARKKMKRESISRLGSEEVFLCLDQIPGSLWLRPPRPGDRLQPLGMKGRKKLKEILQELKAPRDFRPTYPVIADEKELLWAPGFGISEKAKVTPGSKSVFLFKLSLSIKI